ncbi:DNA-binding transcriptional repressor DeoR [Erwinia tasmaniensis]|uniref:Deoxyribose operon repressor n=1 Tax=Erwinia tasmaniensis (strain DSM 17950 / CFBP 7177 / CIP 109463 / NCPPB 4357 / Et1/99) TaxID=465817 RepID=B2VH32_ERWT9|nr:DNA-binding transcriptional repressor DeoR [Erwinia tasmaniensis]CAO95727.1 Deoxyribose operon repressor [Erwinia tasmaniensis Et1/99]
METRRDKRINMLSQALQRTAKIHLKEAAQLLGVSEMTIRRDLNEGSAAVVLLGGYIVGDGLRKQSHYFVSDQQAQNVDRKRLLGQLAAAMIHAEETVWFDCGTTIPWIIDAIDDDLPFTAVCCAMNTFLALKEKPACRVILCGGEFRPDNAIFTPLGQPSVMESLCPDKAFISAAGVDLRQGASCYNLNELPIKHLALQRSRQKFLVADSSKFGQVLSARIAPLSAFDLLISDAPHPDVLPIAVTSPGSD